MAPSKTIVKNGRKKCTRCEKWLTLDMFFKHKRNSSGRASECKSCHYLVFPRDDSRRKYEKQYYEDNKEKIGEYKSKWRKELKLRCIARYGGKCIRCGFDDARALQFDHVNGGRTLERKKFTGEMLYNKIMNDKIGTYQLLCANCNWIKRHENGEWK